MGPKITSLTLEFHEATHAVVAAYLRVPFDHVTIKANRTSYGHVKIPPASVHPYSWPDEGKKEITRQLTDRAIVAFAPRAARDLMFERENSERENSVEYWSDEQVLKGYARQLKDYAKAARLDFDAWRAELLARAREIVRIGYVNLTISDVAFDLYEAAQENRGLSAKHVREVLRSNKELAHERSVRRLCYWTEPSGSFGGRSSRDI
jgi:hypothetical protein